MKEEYKRDVEHIDRKARGDLPGKNEENLNVPKGEGEIRVMQWNILADGLSDDGFLVRDILQEGDPKAQEAAFLSMAQEVQQTVEEAKPLGKEAKEKALNDLKTSFSPKEGEGTPEAREKADAMQANHSAIIDWTRRWLKMRELIARFDPDVITMQEVDRMAEVQRDLHELGCACLHRCKSNHGAARAASSASLSRARALVSSVQTRAQCTRAWPESRPSRKTSANGLKTRKRTLPRHHPGGSLLVVQNRFQPRSQRRP